MAAEGSGACAIELIAETAASSGDVVGGANGPAAIAGSEIDHASNAIAGIIVFRMTAFLSSGDWFFNIQL
jgi:hypothetical protein